jgi:tripartite-type tricarboxylate transporter receptor subunit TctC
VMDHERSKFLPDVPTMKESGYPTVISSSTRGIAAPKGTPPAILSKLRDVLKTAMEHPDHVKKLEDQGIALKIMVGEEYEKYFADIHAKAKKYTEWAKTRPMK